MSGSTSASSLPIPIQDTRLFSDQSNVISQMEDFDLFNSLDWSFDETIPLTWS